MTNDIDALDQLVTDGVTSLVTNCLTIIGAASCCSSCSTGAWRWRRWRSCRFLLVGTLRFRTRSARSYALVRNTIGDVARAPAGVDLSGMRVLKAFRAEQARHDDAGRAGQRRLPRRQHADRGAERPLLPLRRAHVGGRHGHRALVRRLRWSPASAIQVGVLVAFIAYLTASSTRSSSSPSSTTPSSRRWRPCRRSTRCSTPIPTCSDAPDARPLPDVRGRGRTSPT